MQKKKKKKKQKRIHPLMIFIGMLSIILLAVYLFFAVYYKNHFYAKTVLDGVDVSGLTAQEAQDKLEAETSDFLLTVYDKDGNKYLLKGVDFGYEYHSTGSESDFVSEQNIWNWPAEIAKEKSLTLDKSVTYDEEAFKQAILGLDCFNAMVAPVDAYVGLTDNGFEIVPEVKGNTLIQEQVFIELTKALTANESEVTLSSDCYEQPQVSSEDASLKETLATGSTFLSAQITYDIEGTTEIVDQSVISTWLTLTDEMTIAINEDAVTSYVQGLASTYNTFGDERQFKTHLGDTVTIGGGDYGWIIDKDKEKTKLLEEIRNGEIVTREPEYTQTALGRGDNEIQDSYIEIDYTNQHMYYYKDGILELESDIVTGNISKNNGSPDGIFDISYKQSPATLVGEDYVSPVQYFMVFAYNVGFHDASWRSEFGGQIYKTSGSHGCINMPAAKAKELFSVLEVKTPVIAYYREKVVLTAENAKISNAYSYQKPETTN